MTPLIEFIQRKIRGLITRYWRYIARVETVKQINNLNGKTIFLIGFPIHVNLGDQAQALCILNWLNENYPDYQIFTLNWNNSTEKALALLQQKIGKDDVFFGHSGYFFYEPHRELPIFRRIALLFPDHKFVILPQTINLTETNVLEETKRALNSHPNLTLICRDEISFDKAKKDFGKCKLLLYPDIVTSLIGTKIFNNRREGILLCIRNDSESFYSSTAISELQKRLNEKILTEITDTYIDIPYYAFEKNRENILNKTFEEYAQYKLIITDRFHGMIFALISSTPVVVLSTTDHKLRSGVKWFPESFSEYVKFANDLDEAYAIALNMRSKRLNQPLPKYFEENFLAKLKVEID